MISSVVYLPPLSDYPSILPFPRINYKISFLLLFGTIFQKTSSLLGAELQTRKSSLGGKRKTKRLPQRFSISTMTFLIIYTEGFFFQHPPKCLLKTSVTYTIATD